MVFAVVILKIRDVCSVTCFGWLGYDSCVPGWHGVAGLRSGILDSGWGVRISADIFNRSFYLPDISLLAHKLFVFAKNGDCLRVTLRDPYGSIV